MLARTETKPSYLKGRLQSIYDRLGNRSSVLWTIEDAEAARKVFLKGKRLQAADPELTETLVYLGKRLRSIRKHLREKKAVYWSGRDATAIQAILRELNRLENLET